MDRENPNEYPVIIQAYHTSKIRNLYLGPNERCYFCTKMVEKFHVLTLIVSRNNQSGLISVPAILSKESKVID